MSTSTEYQRNYRAKNREKTNAQAAARTRKYRSKNRDKVNEQARIYARRQLPEPTRPCPSLCEACGQSHIHALCLDHDHVTNKFRGWLCKSCNLALGYAKDSLAVLDGLKRYLLDA